MTWLVLLAVGLGSYAFRLAPLLLFHRVTLSERGDRIIRDAGTAAITALIVVSSQSATSGSIVPVLSALAVGLVLAARGASMFVLLAVGGATYAGTLILMHALAS